MGVFWPPKFDRLSRPSGALIIVCGCLAALLLWAQAPLGRLLPLSSPGALTTRLQGPGHQRIPKILHQGEWGTRAAGRERRQRWWRPANPGNGR